MPNKIRLAVISDLHYKRHQATEVCRPATSGAGSHADPMKGLIEFLEKEKSGLSDDKGVYADYLLCPGDITDRASADAFDEGWLKLKELQKKLGASHLVSSTGNHEVDSRAGEQHNIPGNAELELDPLAITQRHPDYPSTALTDGDRRWIYWGRGYEFIEEENVVFLIVNSSHFHSTTRDLEFERGRIGDVALSCLRSDLKHYTERAGNRLLVLLLHHHPISHQDLNVELGKIEMDNGAKLMEMLSQEGKAWLIVHGHKHHPRLITSQGPNKSVVFAAGSFGAVLDGALATQTRLQFYIIECELLEQNVQPEIVGHIRAFSWSGLNWNFSERIPEGLPDRCGFVLPQMNLRTVAQEVKDALRSSQSPYLTWSDLVTKVPKLKNFLPAECGNFRKALSNEGIKTSWTDDKYFPEDAAL